MQSVGVYLSPSPLLLPFVVYMGSLSPIFQLRPVARPRLRQWPSHCAHLFYPSYASARTATPYLRTPVMPVPALRLPLLSQALFPLLRARTQQLASASPSARTARAEPSRITPAIFPARSVLARLANYVPAGPSC